MRHLKHIRELAVYKRLWSIKTSDFMDVLIDLNDISSSFNIQYTYFDDKSDGSYSYAYKLDGGWKSPSDVDTPPKLNQIPGIIINASFYELDSIEKSIEFYSALAESVDRLKEKYNKGFSCRMLKKEWLADLCQEQRKPVVGYLLAIVDDGD